MPPERGAYRRLYRRGRNSPTCRSSPSSVNSGEAPASDCAAMAALTAETGAEAPASLRELDKLEVRFKTVLQPADIRTAALR